MRASAILFTVSLFTFALFAPTARAFELRDFLVNPFDVGGSSLSAPSEETDAADLVSFVQQLRKNSRTGLPVEAAPNRHERGPSPDRVPDFEIDETGIRALAKTHAP